MKKLYNFFRNIFNVTLLFCCFAASTLSAQNVIIDLVGNPSPIRLQPATFSVNLLNTYGTAITNYTLEATASTGYTVTPTEITGITVAAGGTETLQFTVIADCTAPQEGGTITYTLKDDGENIVFTEKTSSITITESDFQFQPSTFTHIADLASATKTYTRTWSLLESAPEAALSHVKITNTCNKTNFEIVKVEVMSADGNTVYADITETPNFDYTNPNTYIYIFDSEVFKFYENYDDFFNHYEEVFIRETYKIKNCGDPSTATYTIEYGDGTNYCPDENTATVNTSVAELTYASNPTSLRRHDYQTSAGGIGTVVLQFTNSSSNSSAIKRDLILGEGFTPNNANNKLIILRAYFTDADGNTLGLPDLMTNVTANTTVNFNTFDSDYAITGLIDADDDGIYNDLPIGKSIYVKYEYRFNFTNYTQCSVLVFNEQISSRMNYTNNCGTVIIESSAGGTYTPSTVLGYTAPQNAVINPPNIVPGNTVTLSYYETNTSPQGINWSSSGNFSLNVTNYDHYVLITLPKGFDYNLSTQGVTINGILVDISDVTKSTDANGRVVLTVQNRVANMASTMNYSVDIFFDPSFAIPCKDALDKMLHTEHEWAFKNDPTHYKYACYNTPLDFLIVDPTQCLQMSFDVKRMTFGWTNYDKTERITVATADSYGVNRSAAGPWDNVDFTATMKLICDTTYDGSSIYDGTWYAEMGYNAPTAGGCFFFPDPTHAVEINILNKGTVYLTEDDVLKGNSGNRYTFRVDLTPYTLEDNFIQVGDIVEVVYKMQTNENMPDVLTPISNLSMVTDFNPPLDTCGVLTSLQQFSVVDYAVRDIYGSSSQNIYNENNINRVRLGGTVGRQMSSSRIFPNEYRPDQYMIYYEIGFNVLWDIVDVSIEEYQLHATNYDLAGPNTATPLTSSDYSITHTDGKTTIAITKEFQSNVTTNRILFTGYITGAPYCGYSTLSSLKVTYLYYPSSERTDRTEEFNHNTSPYHPTDITGINNTNKNFYTTSLTTTETTSSMTDGSLLMNFDLTNLSYWTTTGTIDNVLPYSWLSVTVPAHVPGASLLLEDDMGNSWSNFVSYASGKYWVQLGNLTVPGATPKNFTLSCNYGECKPFDVELEFGQSKLTYPVDPATGYVGATAPCPKTSTLTLHAAPILSALRGTVTDAPYDGVTGYTFCNPHTFKATFYNTQPTPLTKPVLKLTLCKGLELLPGVTATQNYLSVTVISVEDSGPTSERTVIITLNPTTILTPFNTPGDTIQVTFDLQPTCDFSNGYVAYITYNAETPCGNTLTETKHTTPLKIDGMFLTSNYLPSNFLLSNIGTINLSSSSVSDIDLTATITLTTNGQLAGDYIAISVPPNMDVVSHNDLGFTLWKTESGNEIYQAAIPTMAQLDEINVDVTLTPVNPELWDCDSVTIALFTGAYLPINCGTVPCGIDMKHDNDTITKFEVIKPSVEFLAGSISAVGSFYSTISESVIFTGTLTLPINTHIEDLVIEVFSNKSGEMLPIPNTYFLISEVKTEDFTEVEFTSPALEIPAEDICYLYLVIRKTEIQNYFICENSIIQVPTVMFALSQTSYTVCVFDDLLIGTTPISGYTYTWTPDTYITSETNNAFATVTFPVVLTDPFTYNLWITREGCPAVQTAITVTTEDCTVCEKTYTVCDGETDLTTLIDYTETTDGAILTFYDINVVPEEIIAPPVVSLAPGFYYYAVKAKIGEDGCASELAFLHLEVESCISDPCPVTPIPPTIKGPQIFCENATVGDLKAPDNVIWYDGDGNKLDDPTKPLVHQEIYYASQTNDNDCESDGRTAIMVLLVNETELPAPVIANQTLCNAAKLEDIITDGSGGIVIFAPDGHELAVGEPLNNSGTYKAIYRYGTYSDSDPNPLLYCESKDTAEFTITLTGNPLPLPVIANQEFCEGATLANIVVPNANIVWYFDQFTGNPLPSDTILLGPAVYELWAAQNFENACNETERVKVNIEIKPITVPQPYTYEPYIFCEPPVLIGEIDIMGYGTTWYDDEFGDELPLTYSIPSGIHYFWAELRGNNTCYTTDRIKVKVQIGRPLAPTLETYYPFCDSSEEIMLSDLLGTLPNNLVWYNNLDKEIDPTTEEITSSVYFYATQMMDGCESVGRTNIFVELFDDELIPAPENFTVTVCSSATVADLMLMYPTLLFYDVDDETLLEGSETLTEDTYYTAYKFAADCENVTFGTAEIIFTTGNNGPTIDDQAFCTGVTLGNLISKYPGIDWFIEGEDIKVALTAADSEMPLTDGMVLYAAFNSSSLCATKDSTELHIKIGYDIDEPILKGATTFCEPVSLQQINIEGYDIIWYKDAALTQEADVTELITETTTFYAVSNGYNNCASKPLEVTVGISPVITIGSEFVAAHPHCGDSDGKITFIIEGEGDFEYTVMNVNELLNAADPDFEPVAPNVSVTVPGLSAGVYKILARDINYPSCAMAISKDITLRDSGNLHVSAKVIAAEECNLTSTGTAILEVTGGTPGYLYTVDGGKDILKLTLPPNGIIPLSVGPHTIEVEDFNGCKANCGVVFIGVRASDLDIEVEVTADAHCEISDGEAKVVVHCTSLYSYQLNSGALKGPIEMKNPLAVGDTITFTKLPAGIHSVVVFTDCDPEGKTIRFTVNNEVGELWANVTPTNVLYHCDGSHELGTLFIEAGAGNPPYQYRIDHGDWMPFPGMDTEILLTDKTQGVYHVEIMDDNDCTFEVNVVRIDDDLEPQVSIGTIHDGIHPTCETDDGTILLYLEGGSGAYEYEVFRNSQPYLSLTNYTTPIISGLEAGTYTIKVRDAHYTCAIAVSDDVTLYNTNTNLHVSVVTTDAVDCNSDGKLFIDVTGGTEPFTYKLNGDVIPVPTGAMLELPVGSYILEVTDADNCTASSEEVWINSETPYVTINTKDITSTACGADMGVAVFELDGTVPYYYQLHGHEIVGPLTGENTVVFTGLTAGNYTLYVTGCGKQTEHFTILNTDPDAFSIKAIPTHVTVYCDGQTDDGFITLSVSGASSNYEYSYDGGENWQPFTTSTVIIPNLKEGTYTIIVKDDNSDCIFVNDAVRVGREMSIFKLGTIHVDTHPSCVDDAGTITTTDGYINFYPSGGSGQYQYRIVLVDGTPVPGFDTFEDHTNPVGPLGIGNYHIEVIDKIHNCAILSAPLVLRNQESLFKVQVYPTGVINCSTDAFGTIYVEVENGTGPYEYRLNNTDSFTALPSTSLITGLSAGLYTVEIKDLGDDCNITTSGEVRVVALGSTFKADLLDVMCSPCGEGEGLVRIAIEGESPYYYQLDYEMSVLVNSNKDTIVLSGLQSGTHFLRVYGDCGESGVGFEIENCDISDKLYVIAEGFDVDEFLDGTTVTAQIHLRIFGGTHPYQYTIDGWKTWKETTGPDHTVLQEIEGLLEGTYKLEVRDAAGCTYETNVIIAVYIETGKLISCPSLFDRYPYEDAPGAGYTHIGTDWDIFPELMMGLDSVQYVVDGVIYSHGKPASLDGYIFPLGTSNVMVVAFYEDITDTCYFDVFVLKGCHPIEIGTIAVDHHPTCGNCDGQIIFHVEGGNGNYEYSINNDGEWIPYDDPLVKGLCAGTFTITVRDALFKDDCPGAVSPPITLSSSDLMVNVIPYQASGCTQNDGSIEVTVTGGNYPYTYQLEKFTTVWDPQGSPTLIPLNTALIENLLPGLYRVKITDHSDCMAYSEEVRITADSDLEIEFLKDIPATCNNATGELWVTVSSTLEYGYIFRSVEEGMFPVGVSGIDTIKLTGLNAGTYTVTVFTSCDLKTLTLTVTNGSDQLFVTASSTNLKFYCESEIEKGEITLTITDGNSPYQYTYDNGTTWSAPFTNPNEVIPNLNEGVYYVIVKDVTDCTFAMDEIKIGVERMTSVAIGSQYVDTHPDCGESNGKIQFYIDGEGEYEYTLYNIAHSSPLIPVTTYTDGLITDLPAGDYIIYVWDKNHPTCDTAISGILTLNSGMFVIDIEPKEIPTCGNTDGAVYVKVTGGSGNYTYLLDDNSTSTTGFITGLTAGTHTVTVTENGTNCSVSKEFFLNASNPDVTVNVMSVTETPCGENAGIAVLTMTSAGSGVYTYQLDYETIGHNKGNQSILLDNLSAGLHVFTITGQCGSDSVQFIIENSDSDLAFTATPNDVMLYCNELELGYIVIEITGNASAYTIDGWETSETITGTPVTIPNLTEGIYKVEIMDEDDCIFEVNDVRINRTSHDPLLIGSHYVDKHPDCGDTNGQIQFYVEGGSGEYEYMLFNTSHSSPLISATTYTDGLITDLPAGDYIIYVWDKNHSDCDTAISGVLTLSSGMFAVEIETGIEPSCGTTNGTIYVKVTGGSGAFTYMVDGIPATPAASGLITGISAGAHTITVTEDGNNCSVTQDFFLNASDSNISISVRTVEPALCGISSGKAIIVMNGTEYTYQLDYETIGNNVGSNIITLDNLSAGLHVVHITGECGKDSVVFIIENSNSDLAFTATPHDVLVSCNDLVLGYIEIEVNGGTPNYTYTMDGWITSTEMTGGATLATIPNLTEGIYKIEIIDEDGCTFEVNDIRINRTTEKPIAFGTIQVITEPDCNTSTGEIQFYLSGGSGNYEYDVYNNSVLLFADQEYSSTAGLITGLTVGNYTIYVRDKSNNCTAAVSDEIVLSNKGTNLTLTVIPNEVSNCSDSNGLLFVSATGGTASYTYTLNGVSTSLVNGEITGLTAGEYVVEITDADGCVANSGKVRIYSTSSGLTITELEHENTICGKATGLVSFEVTGNEPYEYQFDYGDIYPLTGNNTLIFSGLPAGEHILRIFNDCGEVVENINITNGDNSLAFNVAVENVKVYCDGEVENGNITLSVKDGATPYQYRIDGGDWIPFTPATATTYTIPDITVGTYKIDVMDNTGCVYEYNSVKVIRETVEPVSIRSAYVKTEPDCGVYNGAIQFFVQGGSGNYQYSLNGGAFLPYPSDGTISNLPAGTYYIEVIDVSHETCAPAVSQAMTLYSTSTNLKLTVTAEDASSCSSDGSLEITVKGGTSPYTYSLNGAPYTLIMPMGSTTMSFTRPVGAYTVDVRDANGCITGSGEIRITSPDSEYSVNVIDSIGTTCGNAEGIVIFEVTGNEIPYYYQLNGFAPVTVNNLSETITLTGLPAGNHFLKVYGNCGADSTRFNIVNGTGSPSDLSFTAVVNNNMVEFPLGGIIYGDITITITGGTPSYQYRIDKGTWLSVSGSTHNITGLTNGIYYIEVIDANGCYYELNIEVLRILGIDKLLDCSIVIDRAVDEDDYGACHYTHIGDEWDMIIIPDELDSVRYIINDVIYSSGADASLNGAIFPVGVSQVLVIGYLNDRTDTCEFTVTVDRICPSSTTDIEEHKYTVSNLAGLCWTSNLRATVYDDGTEIAFAKPYYSPENADIAYNDSIFGLLYTWYSAVGVPEGSSELPVTDEYGYVQGICPAGWHVPSQEEWNKLETYNANQLQSTLYWLNPPGPGTDDFGFDARPAGWYNGAIKRFVDMYGFAGWWASNADNTGSTASYFWIAYYCDQIQNSEKNKTDGLSVRCILDYCGIDY